LPRKTEDCKPDPTYTPRVILIAQQGTPSLPSSDTLAEAVLWDYSVTCLFEDDGAFEITYNEDRTVVYTLTREDADVRVTAASGAIPRVLIDGSTVRVILERLNAIDVQSARATVETSGFPEPVIPYLESTERIDIGGQPATIAAHLTALLHTLLGTSPFATQPASIEVHYGYTLGGMPIEAPVVLVTRQDLAIGFDDQLIDQIASSLHQWFDAVQPPSTGGRLIFTLMFWSAIPRFDAPLLRLTNVSVAMADVVLG
jgi:hypothetical protein